MFDLDDTGFEPEEPVQLPKRPEPRPIRDPQPSLWIPADLEEEAARVPKVTAKERTKRLLHLGGPTLGAVVTLGVLIYIGYVLLGVYGS
jgi:hypothetical protein